MGADTPLTIKQPSDPESAKPKAVGGVRMALKTPWRQQITLPDEGELEIGREVEPMLGHPVAKRTTQLSRHHARFTRDDTGALHIVDLGSMNGTYLDGVEVETTPIRVGPGQELRLGQDVVCRIIRINEHGEPEDEDAL